ncbi:Mitochondrial-processing peptidase subunit alpha [Trichinella murrelli]|uniref:Mitochondrial-processing peptidase subunit alpha n=1 Tax=Trichinella murrelli TaxID=144512 RepID=A0A0V0TV65_9BILA|nr:Mitochondrial-processing peptidase subunit alpha [Trichinella murrelli]
MKWKKLNSDIVRCVMGSVEKCSLTVLLMQGNGGSWGVGGGSGGHDGILTVAEGHLLLTSVHGRSALVQLFSLPICKCTVTLEIASSCSVGWTNHAVRKTTPRSIQVHQLDDRLSLPSRIDFPVGSSGRDPQHGISPRRATCFREDSSSEVFFVFFLHYFFTNMHLCINFFLVLFASAFLLTNSHLVYKKYYPGTTIERLYVPESETRWKVKSEKYLPHDYTACPQNWKCDPDDPKGIKFNEIDDELDRRTFVRKKYKIDPDGRPLNPKGRTGIRGRGTLAYWGPNHAMMTIISRGKGNNKEYYVMRSNRTTVEAPFLIIYQGYYTDQRNTDNAWSEFTILEIEDPSKEYFNVVEAKRVTLPETGEEVTFQWEELPEEQVERKVKELIKKSDRTTAEKMLHRMRRAKIYFQKQGIHGLLPVLNDFVSNSIGLTARSHAEGSSRRLQCSSHFLRYLNFMLSMIRDGIIYAASCRTDAFKPVLEFIADVMFNPIFSDSEIDQKTLLSFMKTYYTPDRIVVGGVGVDHDQLIEACNEYFEQNVPVWKRRPELLLRQIPDVDKSTAQYTGGEIRIEKDLSNITMSVNPFPELAHVVMGFESCSFMDEDFLCFSLLHSLMGGGGSFSAGGPGKGMYTRLYVNVLNSYADTGIFFIRASAHPNHIDSLIAVLCSEFFRMKENLHTEELNRAKSQIKSSLMMNLEQRPVIFEDLTRQILGSGVRKSPLQFLEDIDKLKADDLIRAVDRMLNSRVSLVGYGTLKQMQAYDLIDRAIVNRDLKLLKTPKLYFT